MQQRRYSIVNRIRLSGIPAASRSGTASLRPVRSDLACLMNHTSSMPRRPILSASSNETDYDLSYQSNADTLHILMVCHFSNRTNGSPPAHLGPIVCISATHLAHSSDPSEVGKGQSNSVFGSISRNDVRRAPLTQISAQTKQHGADRGAMHDSLDESNVRPMVGLIHIASTKSRNSIRYRISRYNESMH